ncbi:MAG: hypothetical protein WA002_18670 [Candidatus Acidiferrales bacterium]
MGEKQNQPRQLSFNIWSRIDFRGSRVPSGSGLQTARRTLMFTVFYRLWVEENGQDLTEYALLLVLIALAAIVAVKNLALAIQVIFLGAAVDLTLAGAGGGGGGGS